MQGSFSLLDPLLVAVPLWALGVLLIATCLLARAAGALVYRHRVKRDPKASDIKSEADDYIITSVFALLAFLSGLTFSIALERYESRRELVVEEATAISTVYLRASLFDEPYRARLQTLLRQYARTRIAPEGFSDPRMDAKLQDARNLRAELWDVTHAAVLPVRETALASYFVDAMNEALNVGVRRENAGREYIPTRILDALFLYLLASSVMLGYAIGANSRERRPASTFLIILSAIVIILILDIDRPRAGSIIVPQTALEELVATLDEGDERPLR